MADGQQVEGVDYAFSRPNIGQLAALGKVFACRYGGPGTSPKHLTPAETQTLITAGIALVANAEGAADGMLGGYSVGVSWARSAEEHFARCGMPSDRPIYLSADFDVTSSQWPAVREALRGAASVLGASRVGVYGGRHAIEWARRDGVARWFWQTYAWSFGYWVPGNHIEQYRNGVTMAGGTLDLDRALVADYGQWGTSEMETDDMSEWSEPDPWGNDPDGYNRTPAQKQRDAYAAVFFGTRPVGTDGEPVGPPPWIVEQITALKAGVQQILDALKSGVPVAAKVDLTETALDQIEERVDRQNDQQSLGGADPATKG